VLGDLITSVSSNQSEEIVIFPNPASNMVQVFSTQSDVQKLKLINIAGSLVFEQTISGKQSQLDVSSLAAGTYFLVVENFKGERISTKLLNVTK
jgi:hypothetical protein